MKSRARELVDKSVAAMVSAIEIYNKPNFKYREETFSILAINSWELLLKAKWLSENGNKIRSLYVAEKKSNSDGGMSKRTKIKLTECGNPFTHGLDYLAKKLVAKGLLPDIAYRNIKILSEIRDSSVHFYNRNKIFSLRLQEIGSAAVKNYVKILTKWFNKVDLNEFNFYLMPLAFVGSSQKNIAVTLSKEERNLASYITALEAANDVDGYSVSVDVVVSFSRSKADDALKVQLTNDPAALKLHLTEEQIKDKYPWNYNSLTEKCRARYANFKVNEKYHKIRGPLKSDNKFCLIRKLDPDNPKSAKQDWYSAAILNELDKHYVLNGKDI
ncbi:DUF3644 domain-containing protein [Chromobacterium violaceum]|uniref:DUF3644 domain-containing protein n=1 Tax=Chromobacterium violaceum TaxID=536 RepID=UPI00385D2F44